MVRNAINLNTFNGMQTMDHTDYLIQTNFLSVHWIEHLQEIKSEVVTVNPVLFKKIKFIIKWWEN